MMSPLTFLLTLVASIVARQPAQANSSPDGDIHVKITQTGLDRIAEALMEEFPRKLPLLARFNSEGSADEHTREEIGDIRVVDAVGGTSSLRTEPTSNGLLWRGALPSVVFRGQWEFRVQRGSTRVEDRSNFTVRVEDIEFEVKTGFVIRGGKLRMQRLNPYGCMKSRNSEVDMGPYRHFLTFKLVPEFQRIAPRLSTKLDYPLCLAAEEFLRRWSDGALASVGAAAAAAKAVKAEFGADFLRFGFRSKNFSPDHRIFRFELDDIFASAASANPDAAAAATSANVADSPAPQPPQPRPSVVVVVLDSFVDGFYPRINEKFEIKVDDEFDEETKKALESLCTAHPDCDPRLDVSRFVCSVELKEPLLTTSTAADGAVVESRRVDVLIEKKTGRKKRKINAAEMIVQVKATPTFHDDATLLTLNFSAPTIDVHTVVSYTSMRFMRDDVREPLELAVKNFVLTAASRLGLPALRSLGRRGFRLPSVDPEFVGDLPDWMRGYHPVEGPRWGNGYPRDEEQPRVISPKPRLANGVATTGNGAFVIRGDLEFD